MRYLIDPRLPQWKGNLHTHTTQSDGRLSPQEVVSQYEQAGYDFLALTDHRKVTDPSSLKTSLLMVPGVELNYMVTGRHSQAIHIIGLGVRTDLMDIPGVNDSAQQGIDAIRAQGGRAIFAHPAWSLNEPETIEALKGLSAVEIYNHVSDAPWNACRGDSSVILDQFLADGFCLPFVGADDAHFYDGDQCFAALIISAPELTRESVFAALDEGRVYATQGPRFQEARLENGELKLRFTPAEQITFYSDTLYVKGRTRREAGMTEASYAPREDEAFLRAEIIDAQGRRAWLSPVLLKK